MQMLNSYFAPAGPGLLLAQSNVTDARITIQSGWTFSGGVGPAGASYYANVGAAGSAVYQPAINADRADFWTYNGAGHGSLQTQVDSANNTVINTATGSGWTKNTISFVAGAAHTISTLGPTVGDIYLMGVEPWLSTSPNTIRVNNWGVSGTKTSDWATALGSTAAIQAYAPDLTVIMLGINDALNGPVTPATYLANLQTVITAAQASGDVILMSVVPSNPANSPDPTGSEAAYQAATQTFAASLKVPYVDVLSRFGSYAVGSANGIYADNLHLNNLGYADLAQAVYKTITA
jgi:lysophospholipase L1-like esterase